MAILCLRLHRDAARRTDGQTWQAPAPNTFSISFRKRSRPATGTKACTVPANRRHGPARPRLSPAGGHRGPTPGDAALLRLMGGIDVLQKVHGGAPRRTRPGSTGNPPLSAPLPGGAPADCPHRSASPGEGGPVRHLSPELTQAGIKLRFAGPAQHILPQAFSRRTSPGEWPHIRR